MADAMKNLREALSIRPAPLWSYPRREGYFEAPCDCAACQALQGRFPDLKSQPEIDAEQGALAPALRIVSGYLTYGVTFAAGWFASAVYSLGVLKGWW